ncbi:MULTISPECIES: hypothetical protein [unclassified Marinobacterium]|uniref:hypothetical protein n=1 Tax=unclassified Marinobacterium TaxID=2644139 RepID=UPI001568FFC1|nr:MULTISPECIES: hypothetical protein [unclassified Marinobacterium]NRP56622.1 hypothetical protein [Marinobacterium sp. xm-d-510]NRP96589.1 hypothetical protein [Marinobacterium sp. xm-a-127]
MTAKGGPKTLEGKLVSQKNSYKHGLTAKKWINEDEASRYSQLVTDLTKEHRPVGTLERFEIERIANCKVRLERIQRIEAEMYLLAQLRAKDPELYLEGLRFDKERHARMISDFAAEMAGIYEPAPGMDDKDIHVEISFHSISQMKTMERFQSCMPATFEHVLHECMERHCAVQKYLDNYIKGSNFIPGIAELITDPEENEKREALIKEAKTVPASSIIRYLEKKQEELTYYRGIKSMIKDFEQHIDLIVSTATPPDKESARIHRERTSAENLLSKCIGELLELQERRFKKERQQSRS